MAWFLLKGLLALFVLFTATGTIGNLFGWTFFKLSTGLNKSWPIAASNIFLYVFSIACFSFMGMFYASYTYALTKYVKLWFAITIVSIFIVIIYTHTVREYGRIKAITKSNLFITNPFVDEYRKQQHFDTRRILSSGYFIVLAYIFFILYNEFADTVSFGFNSYLLELIK